MADGLLEYLSGEFNREIERIEGELALGGAKDYSEYKFLCGVVRGLRTANSIVMDIAKRVREDDE
ncbi:MAG: hypothetical protein ACK4WM_09160 [Thermoflexales bacterium]